MRSNRRIPILKKMAGIEALDLQPEEVFIFTRINGVSSIEEIAKIVNFTESQIESVLERLQTAGFVDYLEDHEPLTKKILSSKEDIVSRLDEEDKARLITLPRSVRMAILLRHREASSRAAHDILGVPEHAASIDIQAAYIKLVKEFHPDKYFVYHLGSYQSLIEDIFEQITSAYKTIIGEKKNRTKAESHDKKDGASAHPRMRRPIGRDLGEKYYIMGQQAEIDGDMSAASNFYKIALGHSPYSDLYRDALARADVGKAHSKVQVMLDKGQQAVKKKQYKLAIKIYEEALAIDLNCYDAYRALALIYSQDKEMHRRACELGEVALALKPEDIDLICALSQAYFGCGKIDKSRRLAQQAMKMNPSHQSVKDLVSCLRQEGGSKHG